MLVSCAAWLIFGVFGPQMSSEAASGRRCGRLIGTTDHFDRIPHSPCWTAKTIRVDGGSAAVWVPSAWCLVPGAVLGVGCRVRCWVPDALTHGASGNMRDLGAKLLIAVILAVLLLGTIHGQASRTSGGSCDRACLEGFVDQFLDAFIRHDPKQLPLARSTRFTENGQRLELGDGSWRSMVGKGTYRLFVSDPTAGHVAFIGTLREENVKIREGALVLIALRLKIDNRQISEIETFIVRSEQAAQNVEKAGKPHPVYLETVPAAERMSREDLIKTANMYFSGMQLNDGKASILLPTTATGSKMATKRQMRRPRPARPDPIPRLRVLIQANWGARNSSSRA